MIKIKSTRLKKIDMCVCFSVNSLMVRREGRMERGRYVRREGCGALQGLGARPAGPQLADFSQRIRTRCGLGMED